MVVWQLQSCLRALSFSLLTIMFFTSAGEGKPSGAAQNFRLTNNQRRLCMPLIAQSVGWCEPPSTSVIRVAGKDRRGAVKLLGDDDAGEAMGERQRTEIEQELGALVD